MLRHTPVISAEGSEYVRMALNLAHGHGLVGNLEGPETMYAPLFSLLTAGVYFVVRSGELAGHLVCLLFGTLLVLPMFLISRHLYGNRVAYVVGLLAALNPLLIELSASIYNENVYLPLLLFSTYFGMLALESRRIRDCCLTGLFIGLAYLTRPEAFAYPVFFMLAACALAAFEGRTNLKSYLTPFCIGAVFLVLAAPYTIFLHAHTGHFRLEGKWNMNFTIANRIRSGMSYSEAAYGLGEHLSEAGPILNPSGFAAYTPYPRDLKNKIRTLLEMARLNRWTLNDYLLDDRPIGAPLIFAFVLIGMFRKAWDRHRLLGEAVLLAISFSIIFLMLTSSSADFRYVLPLLPFLVVWCANGISEAGDWVCESVHQITERFRTSLRVRELFEAIALIAILALSASGASWVQLFSTERLEDLPLKQAGQWLHQQTSPNKRVACVSSLIPYYSESTKVEIPYANSSQALSYLAKKQVNFIVLDAWATQNRPAVKEWMQGGIPDRRVHLIQEFGEKTNKVKIYQWDR